VTDEDDELPPDQEWDSDDGDDLEPYFLFLLRRPLRETGRRFRLALCGACRRHWDKLAPESRAALEVAERHADGLATNDELDAARESAWNHAGTAAGAAVAVLCFHPESYYWLDHAHDITRGYLTAYEPEPDPYKPYRDIVRCVAANPHRPVAFAPEWRTDTAIALARQMYEAHDFGAMPILADALQDAGCDSDDVLTHCRDTSLTHVRGCWVVDLVLGKQ
jgi:hypothetical protein